MLSLHATYSSITTVVHHVHTTGVDELESWFILQPLYFHALVKKLLPLPAKLKILANNDARA